MKILIVSKFFYNRGGAEVVAIGTRSLLQDNGHEVRVFAMDYPKNLAIEDRQGYASQVSFNGKGSKIKAALRTLGRGDVKQAAIKVLDNFNPDVVHLHNVHSYLSPVIAELAHERGIRVVWTLHDYKLVCPAYTFRRPQGEICRDCLGGGKSGVLRHLCMKSKLSASLLAYLEARAWNRERLNRITDVFIPPSHFMGDIMVAEGIPQDKIRVLCNFIDPPKLEVLEKEPVREHGDGYFCYIGRLSVEKGVPTLLEAAKRAGVCLKVAGNGPLLDEMKERYGDVKKIDFLGKLNANEVAHLLNGADASVITSEWYENNPLSVIESLCAGVPVIGARIGGIPELIESTSGLLYPSGNVEALTDIFRTFCSHTFNRADIARESRVRFCRETHYEKLMKIYKNDF